MEAGGTIRMLDELVKQADFDKDTPDAPYRLRETLTLIQPLGSWLSHA